MNGITEREAELLGDVYKNSKMGSDSILKVMPKASNERFRQDLTKQLTGYEEYAQKAKDIMRDGGYKAKEENVALRLWADIGIMINTAKDPSDSHIAEMVVEGSTMGVTDTLKLLRENENSNVSEGSLRLLRDVISFEERNVEIMKGYI